MILYHLTTLIAWNEAQRHGEYAAPSLEKEGFIHCSSAEQLLPVANAFYLGAQDPVVLWIDTGRLQAEVRWESPDPEDPFSENRFPHVYGPIDVEAVVRVTEPRRDQEGRYLSF